MPDINYKKLFIALGRAGIAIGVGIALIYLWTSVRDDELYIAVFAGLVGGGMTYILLDKIKGSAD